MMVQSNTITITVTAPEEQPSWWGLPESLNSVGYYTTSNGTAFVIEGTINYGGNPGAVISVYASASPDFSGPVATLISDDDVGSIGSNFGFNITQSQLLSALGAESWSSLGGQAYLVLVDSTYNVRSPLITVYGSGGQITGIS